MLGLLMKKAESNLFTSETHEEKMARLKRLESNIDAVFEKRSKAFNEVFEQIYEFKKDDNYSELGMAFQKMAELVNTPIEIKL